MLDNDIICALVEYLFEKAILLRKTNSLTGFREIGFYTINKVLITI